jgi:hypothetical protein
MMQYDPLIRYRPAKKYLLARPSSQEMKASIVNTTVYSFASDRSEMSPNTATASIDIAPITKAAAARQPIQ